MPIYERLFPRFRPKRELRPRGTIEARDTSVRLSWLGTAGFVIRTSEVTLLVDPFVSRQGFLRLTQPLQPDMLAIARHIPAKVDAVLCGHSHYDHIADAPRIAKISGAKLVGSASTCAWGRLEGLAENQLVQIPQRGAVVRFGDVEVRFVASRHGKIVFGRELVPGVVDRTPKRPGTFFHYKMGGAFGILVKAPGVSVYHNGSADLIDAELEGEHADVLLACLAGRKGTSNYVARLVSALRPSVVVPAHHDSFFAPLEQGVHLLPGIDLDGFVSETRLHAPDATIITSAYDETISIPQDDPRGALLSE